MIDIFNGKTNLNILCVYQGYHDRLFDLLDERPLTRGEARSFCCLMLGIENENELPDPATHLKEFVRAVDQRLLGERKQWNPVKKVNNHVIHFLVLFPSSIFSQLFFISKQKMTPWINTKSLQRSLVENKCVIM